jgi:hypothetical protein
LVIEGHYRSPDGGWKLSPEASKHDLFGLRTQALVTALSGPIIKSMNPVRYGAYRPAAGCVAD